MTVLGIVIVWQLVVHVRALRDAAPTPEPPAERIRDAGAHQVLGA